eukprot:785905-Alexandrium_andersonii.AAC.1
MNPRTGRARRPRDPRPQESKNPRIQDASSEQRPFSHHPQPQDMAPLGDLVAAPPVTDRLTEQKASRLVGSAHERGAVARG